MAKRGSCEYFKDFFNKRDPLDEYIAPVGEVIGNRQFGIIANKQNVKFNNENCSPQKRCFSLWVFDNKSKGIGNVAFFDYLEDTRTIIFKSYEEICSKICKSVHYITTEIDVDTKNYSIVYSMIAENEKLNRNDPYNIGTDVFTIDEYTKFVNENKNKTKTEMPMMQLFVNMDNFVESELSYTEWLKTQPNALPTVELPKTDELPKSNELPKTDELPKSNDDPPPAYDETGGAKSRRCRKDRKNKSRKNRKSKRRNNKQRRRNTRR